MNNIKIGIIGYGNLGKGVESAIKQNDDMELVGIFTRRDISSITPLDKKTPIFSYDELESFKGRVDVMILCGGSAKDLPSQVPHVAQWFNTVDSFDNHGEIPNFFKSVNEVCEKNKTVSAISIGWDPGLFSMNRLLGETVLPNGKTNTFWGDGLSQGHSDAIRRISGVQYGVQYTIPNKDVINSIRNGSKDDFSVREKHKRVCYVVAEDDSLKEKITDEIVNMPNYFADYDTTVNFISEEEMKKNHTGMPHGGFVIRNGESFLGDTQIMEFSLKLESNPSFTASILVAYARGVYNLSKNGKIGAKTIFDFSLSDVSPLTKEELLKNFL